MLFSPLLTCFNYVKVFRHLHKSKKVPEGDWFVRCCLPFNALLTLYLVYLCTSVHMINKQFIFLVVSKLCVGAAKGRLLAMNLAFFSVFLGGSC